MQQQIRFILIAAAVMLGMMLYNTWQDENMADFTTAQTGANHATGNIDVPNVPISYSENRDAAPVPPALPHTSQRDLIHIKTDVLDLMVDLNGGDFVKLNFPKYPESLENSHIGFNMLDQSLKRFYIAQSGLLSDSGPDSKKGRAKLFSSKKEYLLQDSDNKLLVDLFFYNEQGIKVTKRLEFARGNYLINVSYIIENNSNKDYLARFYTRLKRNAGEKKSGMLGIQTFTGAAISTPEKTYQKLAFSDFASDPLRQEVKGGWAAMEEQYFLSAWIGNDLENYWYHTESFKNGLYGIGFVADTVRVAPGVSKQIGAKLYLGPEDTDVLRTISPGLELTVDYGILWPICQPIFWLLKKIQNFVGNWGLAIILITVLIKALFYKLSATSYRSMGNMKKLQPQMQRLKQQYGDDKQKFGQEMMALYRQEKVNPLGGCLPILVQIPVFIALYYVLIASVELRQAPFMLWIHDLSVKDPFYILPIIMGLSMFLQQRLSPAPPDPVQAKVMMFMPIFFTFLFMQFPAGLVLYWVVNNLLSILQQWYITRDYVSK